MDFCREVADRFYATILQFPAARAVFVDEAQDLNPLQHRVLETLRGGRPDICLVGDPRQAIYGWNGADPALLAEVDATTNRIDEAKLDVVDEQPEYDPGTTATLTVTLPKGHYVVMCNIEGHYKNGMYADLEITDAPDGRVVERTPAPEPVAAIGPISGTEKEWAIEISSSLHEAGTTTFSLQNLGSIAHEFLVVRSDKSAAELLASVDAIAESGRPLIAIEVADGEGVLVGPDNGLLAPAVAMAGEDDDRHIRIREIVRRTNHPNELSAVEHRHFPIDDHEIRRERADRFETGKTASHRPPHQPVDRHASAGAHATVDWLDRRQPCAHHHATDASVANQDVRSAAEHGDRLAGPRRRLEDSRQRLARGHLDEPIGGPARPEGREQRQWRIRHHARHARDAGQRRGERISHGAR